MKPTTTTHTGPGSAFAGLPARQAAVAVAMAGGASITDAAKDAGLHRSTIHEWLQSDAAFSAAVEEARLDYVEQLRDQLRSLSAKALNRIETLIDDPKIPPSVALRAALAVLERPAYPAQSWSLPEPVYTPEEEQTAQNLAFINADYKLLQQEQKFFRPLTTESGRKATEDQPSTARLPKPRTPHVRPEPVGAAPAGSGFRNACPLAPNNRSPENTR